jgi:hypothetical protein
MNGLHKFQDRERDEEGEKKWSSRFEYHRATHMLIVQVLLNNI